MYENTVLSKQGIKLTGLGKFGNFTASLSFAVMEGKTGGSSDLPIFHSEKRFRLYGMGMGFAPAISLLGMGIGKSVGRVTAEIQAKFWL